MRRAITGAVLLFVATRVVPAEAKEVGLRTPGGREIYDRNETFASADDTRNRRFVIEAVAGAGPEGNLGMLIGWLNLPIRGLEYYAGFGVEANPAVAFTLSTRYVFNIGGYRPYVAVGYAYKDLSRIGTFNHNVFGEVGYSWILHQTYHFTAGIGVRRILYVGIRPDSPLNAPDVDQALLAEQKDDINPWVPMFALRFSRAF